MTYFLLPSSTSSLRATKFSATRRPTSRGDVPAGQLRKYDWLLRGTAAESNTAKPNNIAKFRLYKVILLSDHVRRSKSFDIYLNGFRSECRVRCGEPY